jgi:hypothetical protein
LPCDADCWPRRDWPEPFPPGQRLALIAFAIVTWLYRLVLFLGIAVAVYLFFFKLLGILLFMVELSWFIALPVIRELSHWWQQRARIPRLRKMLFKDFCCWAWSASHSLAQPDRCRRAWPVPSTLRHLRPLSGTIAVRASQRCGRSRPGAGHA